MTVDAADLTPANEISVGHGKAQPRSTITPVCKKGCGPLQ
jgi:hypothetical protein